MSIYLAWLGGITMRNIEIIGSSEAFFGIWSSQILGWNVGCLAFLHYFWKLPIQSRNWPGHCNDLAIQKTEFWRLITYAFIILGIHDDFSFWTKSLLDRFCILGERQRAHNLRRSFTAAECIGYQLGWRCFSFLSSIRGFPSRFIWSSFNAILWRLLIKHRRFWYRLSQHALIGSHLFRVQFSSKRLLVTISIGGLLLNPASFRITFRELDMS